MSSNIDDNTKGCTNLLIGNNYVNNSGNHGLECIGGIGNIFKNNVIKNSWATGFKGDSIGQITISHNHFEHNNHKRWNALATLDDENECQILVKTSASGTMNSSIKYLVNIVNNEFFECREGCTGNDNPYDSDALYLKITASADKYQANCKKYTSINNIVEVIELYSVTDSNKWRYIHNDTHATGYENP